MAYTLRERASDWIIKKEHIEKIFDLFKSRFSDSTPYIKIDFKLRNGTSSEKFYEFDKFDTFITKEILTQKREVENLVIYGSQSLKNEWDKIAWFDINFLISKAFFNIVIEGTNEFNDWADGFCNQMKDFFILFKSSDEIVQVVKNKFLEKFKYCDSVIFLDYFEEVKKEVPPHRQESPVINIIQPQIHTGAGDNVHGVKFKISDKNEKTGFIEKITNNQTFAIIFGTLIALFIVYILFMHYGVNLSLSDLKK